jgi:hypothetical protein
MLTASHRTASLYHSATVNPTQSRGCLEEARFKLGQDQWAWSDRFNPFTLA